MGGGQAVGGGLALQVFEGLDGIIVLLDGKGGVDVARGGGEIVGQSASSVTSTPLQTMS